ncbi:MAG: ferritin family protein [Bacteroidales bacterium]|nr:ferritin family protein [Bacteroidales bacterium]
MEKQTATDILKTAILMEKRGKAFYEQVARQTSDEDVQKIFNIMAGEEQIHIDYLSKQFSNYEKNQKFGKLELAEKEGDESIANMILSKDLRNRLSAASFEAAAISAAMDMETKAIEVYSKRAEETDDPNEKKLYQWLADWEKGHHHILHELNEDLKEKIWYDNSFWPF